MRKSRTVWLLVLLLGCRSASDARDYRAVPVLSEQDWGDRLHLEQDGVRVVVGPVSVFPYEREEPEGDFVRGRYHLFTRIKVENTGREPFEVVWTGAYMVLPAGERTRLLATDAVVEGAADSVAGAGPSDLVERLEPGHRTARALIPETVSGIDAGEPLVPLCDGCVYRLVLPVRVGGRERHLEFPYRLDLDVPGGRRASLRGGSG